jgi:hypothetical protein
MTKKMIGEGHVRQNMLIEAYLEVDKDVSAEQYQRSEKFPFFRVCCYLISE